jgi:hypothetical protein
VILTGNDPVTIKLSIECDAISRTSCVHLTGSEPGFGGYNKFEAHTSLTRNDFLMAGGGNFSFNLTLFKITEAIGGIYGRDSLATHHHDGY